MYETEKNAVNVARDNLNTKLVNCQNAGDHGTLAVHTGGRRFDLSFTTSNNPSLRIEANEANTQLTTALANLSGVGGTFTLSVGSSGGAAVAQVSFTN